MPSLFISCVSDEFGNYREHFRKGFERANLDTKIQEDFNAYGGPTMEKLDDYIQHSVAIIHICGDMTGSMANERSLQYIQHKYKDFASRFPALKPVLDGNVQASYTHWEAYLAAYHNKKIFVIAPAAGVERNIKYRKEQEQIDHQSAHLKILRNLGYYPEITFTNKDQLIAELYRSQLGDILNSIPKHKPVNLPYPSIGSQFKGREDFIENLYKILNSASGGISAIAIHALGGMGKTRLAVEYARKYENDYTALLFVNANSTDFLIANIANLSDPKIIDLPDHSKQEEQEKYNAVINWLNTNTGWLLILDNADTIEAVKKLRDFLKELQHGHIIITSRIDNWANPVKHKRLEVLAEDSAINFLTESTNGQREERANDKETARLIANDLGCLALALDQARAYIVVNETSFENYRKTWEANRKDVLAWHDELQTEYPASVAITWQTSFNQLSANAIRLLNRLAWFSPDPIPKTLLETEVPGEEKADVLNAWQELKQYSLATSTEDKKAFTIHKLVQGVARNKMDETLSLQTLKESLNWLNNAFMDAPTDVNSLLVSEPLMPHIQALIAHVSTTEINDPTKKLMFDMSGLTLVQHALSKIILPQLNP